MRSAIRLCAPGPRAQCSNHKVQRNDNGIYWHGVIQTGRQLPNVVTPEHWLHCLKGVRLVYGAHERRYRRKGLRRSHAALPAQDETRSD
jgi:hypothetical protein